MAVADRQFTPHAVLKGEQRGASDPSDHVWLAASAGTGKTYVLSARVLRLLLRGVKPDSILCLTFTKAGAAEMAERVHARLAQWVRLDDIMLFQELEALGEPAGPAQVAAARTLFARVLDSRGGGLRIMTIHAFCQTLLAGFPLEAGIAPGFRPLEGREQATLVRTVLAELVSIGEHEGDALLLSDLSALSLRLGETEALGFLARAAPALEALEMLGAGMAATVRRAMDVSADFGPADMEAACSDGAFDRESLLQLAEMLDRWGGSRARDRLEIVSNWLLGSARDRARDLNILARAWCKADGTLFASKGWVPEDAGYAAVVEQLDSWCRTLIELAGRAELADAVAAGLGAARRYARAYADAKRTRGLVDFDDQIQLTRKLLSESGMGDWIRYKLDQATDHILVDEAQDTNNDQWSIVQALAAEFWAGEGARGDALRTIFAVGDYKQAIFGFQGTDPQHYRRAGLQFELNAVNAGHGFEQLSLNQSFRSTPPVLEVVDAVLAGLGPEALGLDEAAALHQSALRGPGEVLLLPAVTANQDTDDEGEEGWIPSATRDLARKLARQVKTWLQEPMWLANKGRALSAGDIMILVRRRSDLAALLVARLHEEGVAVAGVDRLSLHAPLAVQDLLSAMRFAAQPRDDLSLAELLVSPLIGWTQEDLFAIARARSGSLWDAVPPGEARDALLNMLRAADNITPYAFLENLLSGSLKGRRKLLRRLGEEARDPIDELLNAALNYEREGIASLQQFLDWFDRGDSEIVRDADAAGDAVRVMTVHGAKGLQAPLVILADACAEPDRALERNFRWTIEGVVDDLPLFRPRTAERALVASLQTSLELADDKARKEHWRLLYVAMTRAEERLVIAGSLGPREKGVVPDNSWHAEVERAMMRLNSAKIESAEWGGMLRHGNADQVPASATQRADRREGTAEAFARPDWIDRPAPQEARPPRPLAPSAIGRDDVAQPPPSAEMAAGAERGRMLHALFERLPTISSEKRRKSGENWTKAAGSDASLVDTALRIIEAPEFADIFAADALAEAPIAGVFNGLVIAGTVDRMALSDGFVDIVDFKTGRRVPQTIDAIPIEHVRQMAAYAAVLSGIFTDRIVRASLLYSEGPVLHRLPAALLDAHKPGLDALQDKLAAAG